MANYEPAPNTEASELDAFNLIVHGIINTFASTSGEVTIEQSDAGVELIFPEDTAA